MTNTKLNSKLILNLIQTMSGQKKFKNKSKKIINQTYDDDLFKNGVGTHCAGFVVICKPERKVLLVSTHRGNWGFPKGKRDDGGQEPLDRCAFRELKEETGLKKDQIEPFIIESKEDKQKTVASFNEITDKGKPSVCLYVATTQILIEPIVEDGDELALAKWYDFDKAKTLLVLKNRANILENVIDLVYKE